MTELQMLDKRPMRFAIDSINWVRVPENIFSRYILNQSSIVCQYKNGKVYSGNGKEWIGVIYNGGSSRRGEFWCRQMALPGDILVALQL